MYLAMSVRNAGNGIAVMRAWQVYPEQLITEERPDLDGSGGTPATCMWPLPTWGSGRRRSVTPRTPGGPG